jgi:hypothetical protein
MRAKAKVSFLTCRALAHIIFSETGVEEDTTTGNHHTERGILAGNAFEKDRRHRFGAFGEESDVFRALGGNK